MGRDNSDGIPDLAATESGSSFVSILLGSGDGTYPPPNKVEVGGVQVDLVPGDFNGDGNLDLVTPLLLQTPTELVTLVGTGDGAFEAFSAGEVEGGAVSITSADFNNNGSPDLLVSSNVGIDSLFGRGDATFRPGEGVTPAGPTEVVSGDFNLDGNADFATIEPGREVALVALGEGDGSFRSGGEISTGSSPSSLFTQDLDGDGVLDLVVGDRTGWSVFKGRGDGSFRSALNVPLPRAVVSTGAGDFDNDGILDLAGVDLGVVWLARGKGDGSFHSPEGYAAGPQPNSIVVADLNRDGNLDLATSNGLGRDLSVLLAR